MARRKAVPKAPPRPSYFARLCVAKGLPMPVAEHRFAAPDRDWRFDHAWPDVKVALEVEGGVWRKGGGAHSHPSNIVRDIEKYNRAAVLGWRVVRVVPEKLTSPLTFTMLKDLNLISKERTDV